MKKRERKKTMLLGSILFCILAVPLFSLTIKIGSVAPQRSPWDKALRELAREWTRITKGKVRLKIYSGGIAGSEGDMIRKMRIGVFGGAGFTNWGMCKLYSDVYVLNIPLQFENEEELDYVVQKMMPIFKKKIEEKGYKFIIWTTAGWVHIFTKHPVLYPEDLKKHKLSFTTGEPEMEQFWKVGGFQVIPNELKDLMMGLQSGMVNAFYLPPLMAASGQYFPLAPNMLSLKVAPLIGGIVVTEKVWEQVPDEYKEEMLAITKKMSLDLYEKTKKLEQEAMEKMKENGLVVNEPPIEARKKWLESAQSRVYTLVGKSFSKEIYEMLQDYLQEFRVANATKQQK